MGMSAVRGMVSCVLMAVAPAAILPASLLGADSGGAMLYAEGAAWLNGEHVPNSSAIFAGDLVQTRSDSGASIHAPGSSITVLKDSLVKFEGASLDVEHGGVLVSTSKGEAATAGDVRVTPASNAWTEFNVINTDGTVRITARKGDLTITGDEGTETLAQGQETTRDDQSDQDNNRKKKKKKGGDGVDEPVGHGTLDSRIAMGAGAAIIGGITAWVLFHGDDPVSPATP